MYLSARFNLEAHYILFPCIQKSLHLILRKGERVAHLHAGGGVILEVGHFSPLCVELVGGVEGQIGGAAVKQLVNILLVNIAAF